MRHAAVIVAVLASLAAALGPASPAHAQGSKQLVRVPFPQDDGTLTPYSFELGYPLVTLVYDTLLWRDRNGTPQPWLARSVRRGANGRRLTLRLRRDVRWHDDRALTAADVVFTFDFVKRNTHLRFTPQLAEVQSVRALDPYTVQIDLRRPVLGFMDQPLADLPILPRHLWAGRTRSDLIPSGLPIGSGPYRLTSYGPGRGYIFSANRGYFRGAPRVDRLEVEVIRTSARTFDALRRGNVDMVPAGLTKSTTKGLSSGLGVDIRRGVNYTGTALTFNLRSAPFDDPRVRRAVSDALDLDQIAQAVGEVLPASTGFVHPRSRWAPSPGLHRKDEEAARRVMESLGRPPIEILAPENNPPRLGVGRQVVGALRRIGADATLSVVSRGTIDRALGADGGRPAFQAAITGIPSLVSYDPDYLRNSFGSRGRLNQSGYRSGVFDRLSDRAVAAPDRGARRRAVAAELRRLASDAPAVPLVFSEGAFAYRASAYNGWVFVKGAGILDKRSFLPGEAGAAARLPEVAPPEQSDDDDFPLGPFGIAAAVLLFFAIAVGAATFSRRRSRVR